MYAMLYQIIIAIFLLYTAAVNMHCVCCHHNAFSIDKQLLPYLTSCLDFWNTLLCAVLLKRLDLFQCIMKTDARLEMVLQPKQFFVLDGMRQG